LQAIAPFADLKRLEARLVEALACIEAEHGLRREPERGGGDCARADRRGAQ